MNTKYTKDDMFDFAYRFFLKGIQEGWDIRVEELSRDENYEDLLDDIEDEEY